MRGWEGTLFCSLIAPPPPRRLAGARALSVPLFGTSRPHTCLIRRPDGSIKVSVKPQIN